MSRRQAVGVLAGAFFGALIGGSRPGWAAALGRSPSGPASEAGCASAAYCPSIAPCLCDDEYHICCTPSETCCPGLGGGCCPKNVPCGPKNRNGTQTCGKACPKGTTVCHSTCCGKGERCVRSPHASGAVENRCCPAKQACGTSCCDEGEVCMNCGTVKRPKWTCCSKGESCIGGKCCPTEQACGTSCCDEGEMCMNCGTAKAPKRKCCPKPKSNGCGTKDFKVRDTCYEADFLPACNAHDICYGTCGTTRAACDKAFARNLANAINEAYPRGGRDKDQRRVEEYKECISTASWYYGGVINRGEGPYDEGQKEGCACCA